MNARRSHSMNEKENGRIPFSDDLSPEQISKKKQFSYFEQKDYDEDFPLIKTNKSRIRNLMRGLEKRKLLAGISYEDFEIIAGPFIGCEAVVYKVTEKSLGLKRKDTHSSLDLGNDFDRSWIETNIELESSKSTPAETSSINNKQSNTKISPPSSNYSSSSSNPAKALKKMKINIRERKLTLCEELELITSFNQENLIKVEKVFFDYEEETKTYSVYLLMPWIEHTFMSWMLRRNDSKGTYYDIPNNKRRFEELRYLLISILKGITFIHSKNIIYLDLRFDHILVREVVSDEAGSLFPTAILLDLGIGKTSSNLKAPFGFAIEVFAAPEIIQLKEQQKLQNSLDGSTSYENLRQEYGNLFEESDFITKKADIYSLGVMLYKLFIDEENDFSPALPSSSTPTPTSMSPFMKNTTPSTLVPPFMKNVSNYSQSSISAASHNLALLKQINFSNIRERLTSICPFDTVSDTLIEDLEFIIQSCLETDLDARPNALELLNEHPFFHAEASKTVGSKKANLFGMFTQPAPVSTSKTHVDDPLPNTKLPVPHKLSTYDEFGIAIRHIEDIDGFQFDFWRSREIFERLAGPPYNHAPSQFTLGILKWWGYGGAVDEKGGLELMETSAKEARAFFEQEVEKFDKKESQKSKNKEEIANQNSNIDSYSIVLFYTLGMLFRFEKNYEKAFFWVHRASKMGSSFARFCLGVMYENGEFVQKNYTKALELYKISADQGDVAGQFNLAVMLRNGIGTHPNPELALKYYTLSADQDYCIAQSLVGFMYFNGIGTQMDKPKAIQYYQSAAKYEVPEALLMLGLAHEFGDGCPKDLPKAKSYYERAAALGIEEAIKGAQRLKKVMI